MGPKNFMFRGGADVIDIREIPSGFTAVLTGHMHRHQVLQEDLRGKPIATPVLYAGSIERTSFAEKDEMKGYMIIELGDNTNFHWQFHELPASPMVSLEIDVTNMAGSMFTSWLGGKIKSIPPDSIVRIKIHGKLSDEMLQIIKVESLRAFVPDTMNIDIVLVDYRRYNKRNTLYRKNMIDE